MYVVNNRFPISSIATYNYAEASAIKAKGILNENLLLQQDHALLI